MKRRLISFDWALKRLLRSKANFKVLEGFLSELLKDDIKILEFLESESNQQDSKDKFNRVDLKVRNNKGEIIIIEVQYERELDFLQRVLYSTSKTITEHLKKSESYKNVVKVISVNILFFDLGEGKDYVYHGTTDFRGIHNNEMLHLSERQKQLFSRVYPRSIFPEYYLLNVKQFDDIARDPLDEWIYFLKNEEIKGDFRARGLAEAKEILDVLHLTPEERAEYESYIDDVRYQRSMFESSYGEGLEEGRKEGLEEGRKKGLKEGLEKGMAQAKRDLAVQLLDVLDDEVISAKTGLRVEEVKAIRDRNQK